MLFFNGKNNGIGNNFYLMKVMELLMMKFQKELYTCLDILLLSLATAENPLIQKNIHLVGIR